MCLSLSYQITKGVMGKGPKLLTIVKQVEWSRLVGVECENSFPNTLRRHISVFRF